MYTVLDTVNRPPEGCLMRKVNKTPKVAAESRMAGRYGSGYDLLYICIREI